MYHSPYRAPQANSYIRMFHASPDTPTVDIYANGSLIVKNLAYKQFTPYISLSPGNYNIKLYPTGQTANPILDTNLYVPANSIFNVAIIGTPSNLGLYPLPEPVTAHNYEGSCIRFVNLSENSPSVDVNLSDGRRVFNQVGYKDFTSYACMPSGTYTFNIIDSGNGNVIITIPNYKLMPNTYYSIYLVGNAGGTPPLEAIVVSEPR
jgi:hypothetical protein